MHFSYHSWKKNGLTQKIYSYLSATFVIFKKDTNVLNTDIDCFKSKFMILNCEIKSFPYLPNLYLPTTNIVNQKEQTNII